MTNENRYIIHIYNMSDKCIYRIMSVGKAHALRLFFNMLLTSEIPAGGKATLIDRKSTKYIAIAQNNKGVRITYLNI